MFYRHFHDFERSGPSFERHSRIFRKGDLKYVILELLKDKSAHGYEITLALENRFHGLYSPSAGSVYPILQLLEDMGLVTLNVTEGKKIYTITESGQKFLNDRKDTTEEIKARFRTWWNSGNQEYLEDIMVTKDFIHDINRIIRKVAMRSDHGKIVKINKVLEATLKSVEQISKEESTK